MSRTLRPTLISTSLALMAMVTDDEWQHAAALCDTGEPEPQYPVRLTLDADGNPVSFVHTDSDIIPQSVGRNPVIDGENLTIDALMVPGVVGSYCPTEGTLNDQVVYFLTIPMIAPAEGLEGYAHEHYRLRSVYLPLPPGSLAARRYEPMRTAIATIDIATQTVEAIAYRKSVSDAPLGLEISNNNPEKIAVVAFLANNGCNFSRVVE